MFRAASENTTLLPYLLRRFFIDLGVLRGIIDVTASVACILYREGAMFTNSVEHVLRRRGEEIVICLQACGMFEI